MSIKIKYYLFSLLIAFSIKAQIPSSYYNSTFGFSHMGDISVDVNEIQAKKYAVLSSSSVPNFPWQFTLYLKDSALNIIDSNTIALANSSLGVFNSNALHFEPIDSVFFVSGLVYEDYFGGNTTSHGILWKLNYNLDTIWHKTYSNSNDSSIRIVGSILLDSSLILFGQSKQLDSKGDAFVLKTDFEGNEIFRRTYQVPNQFGGFTKLIKTKENKYLGVENLLEYPSWGYSDIKITQYDSIFNPTWSQIYSTPYLDYLGDLIELNDSNYVFSQGLGITQSTPPWGTIFSRGTITKISKNNGGVIWQQSYGAARADVQMYNVVEKNNRIYALGFVATSCAPQVKPNCTHISYMLVADQNGDSLHYAEVFSDSISQNNYLFDLVPIADGFICIGSASILNATATAWEQQNWIVKADTNGCFNIDCAQGIGIIENGIEKSNVLLFPNPTNSLLNIKFQYSLSSLVDNRFVIVYNTLGEIVMKQKISSQTFNLNVSEFESGIYFVTITDNNVVQFKEKFIKE
jgi:hypothetical protein